ncbi:pectinesterase family protein, partial [Pontibacter sp. 13R65]
MAKDGSGTHTSIKRAVDAVLTNRSTRTLIFVKNGIYEEKIHIPFSNISLIGESRDGVIVSWDDYSDKPGTNISTATSYTIWAAGDDLYMENMTVRNTAGNVGQAVAIRTT